MLGILFDTLDEAQDFSAAQAANHGCDDGTVYWYSIRPTTNDKFAVEVGNDFAVYDEDGQFTGHSEAVVDVSGLLPVPSE